MSTRMLVAAATDVFMSSLQSVMCTKCLTDETILKVARFVVPLVTTLYPQIEA